MSFQLVREQRPAPTLPVHCVFRLLLGISPILVRRRRPTGVGGGVGVELGVDHGYGILVLGSLECNNQCMCSFQNYIGHYRPTKHRHYRFAQGQHQHHNHALRIHGMVDSMNAHFEAAYTPTNQVRCCWFYIDPACRPKQAHFWRSGKEANERNLGTPHMKRLWRWAAIT
jgi:hypothetical protein